MVARGCAIGVLAGLLVVAFESDIPGKICEYNQATNHEECTTYSLFPFLLIQVFNTLNYYGVAITALATVAIGIFTLTLKLSTDRLWVAGEKQRQLYEDTAKRQLRAYLAVESGVRDGPHTLTPHFKLVFKNCGQTPAYNGEGWVDAQVHEYPLVSDLIPQENKTINKFEMPPTNRFFAERINANNVASIAERSGEFDGGKIAFYIFGRLTFVDAFDNSCWLEYRFRYGNDCVVRGNLIIEEINGIMAQLPQTKI